MQAGYFQTSWNDIKHSEGWAKKVALLALLQFVPIFGQIVLMGYCFAWAREIAWDIHAPLPAKIFNEADGQLYSRGFFILVISFVFSLIPTMLYFLTGVPMYDGDSITSFAVTLSMGGWLVSLVLYLAATILSWVGSMRATIYGRLGPGFQIPQIWKMIQYDTNGLMRIMGMMLLISCIIGVIFSILMSLFGLVGFGALVSCASAGVFTSGPDPVMTASSVFLALILLLVCTYVIAFVSVWIELLVARALGYWTRQFNVPAWGGQDEPMPFEVAQAAQAAQAAQYAAQVQYAQAQAEAAQVQGQKIAYQNQQAQQQYAKAEAAAAPEPAVAATPEAATPAMPESVTPVTPETAAPVSESAEPAAPAAFEPAAPVAPEPTVSVTPEAEATPVSPFEAPAARAPMTSAFDSDTQTDSVFDTPSAPAVFESDASTAPEPAATALDFAAPSASEPATPTAPEPATPAAPEPVTPAAPAPTTPVTPEPAAPEPATPATPAAPAQTTPDWISHVNATAPTEQRSPYAAPAEVSDEAPEDGKAGLE